MPLSLREDVVPSAKMTDVHMPPKCFQMHSRTILTLLYWSVPSDVCAPVNKILQLFPGKRVVVAFPPGRRSAELERVAAATFVIGKGRLKNSQFPDCIKTSSGFIVHKPDTWV